MAEMSIRQFDVNSMRCDRACVLIGASGTGKSHLATDLLYHASRQPGGISAALIFCGTHSGDPYWSKFCPETFIYDDFDKDKVEELILIQMKIKRKIDALETEMEQCERKGNHTEINKIKARVTKLKQTTRKAIILDDCSWDKKLLRDPLMRKLFMCGRHWNIFLMLTLQYAIDLPIDLRGNAGYIFCCRENILSYRKRIHEQFFGMVKLPLFHNILDSCTQSYDVLVLDRTIASTNPTDSIFWYHAAQSRKFTIGSKKLWEYHNKYYNPDHEERSAYEKQKEKGKNKVQKAGNKTKK